MGDLSFISLELVLPALVACTAETGIILPMVKPQFEVGKGQVGPGGVVTDPVRRAEAVWKIVESAAGLGWGPQPWSRALCRAPKGM
ncbi:hypothetical protein GCM10029992_51900 [Glycomyces albus]